MAETPVLDLKGLCVQLPRGSDRPHAVEDITFSVGAGQIVCVVGESGSGKSVTAQAVMGLLPRELNPSSGQILLQGEDVLQATASRLRDLRGTRMAMIFQEPMTALNPVMKVGDQIAEVLEIHTELSEPDRRKRASEVMRAVHLPEPERLLGAYPHQLSGGQRQRIMIAAALVLDPALLIADEPTTALDVTTQAQILRLIRELQERRGTGVMFITHDFGVVAEIAHRVVVMQSGRVVEMGLSDDILRRPQCEYTRMLIASVPSLKPPARAPKSGATALAMERLSKTYGGRGLFHRGRLVRAAENVDITVRRGETVGIVGESGSGKTTVARCVARLIEPTSGSIRIDNVDVARLPESRLRAHRRHVQIVFQDPYRSLNPRRTVGEAIVEGPMNYGATREAALATARRLVELVQLDPGSLDRYPH
jgi:peptide/nickel transport system ATP-binding protein